MARIKEVTVTLVDDFDGSEAAETIKFGFDGRSYEIDLSRTNATELRKTLRPYVDRARRAGRGTTSRSSVSKTASRRPEGYDRTEVRAWAKANRIKVSPRGRISSQVVEKWRTATGN